VPPSLLHAAMSFTLEATQNKATHLKCTTSATFTMVSETQTRRQCRSTGAPRHEPLYEAHAALGAHRFALAHGVAAAGLRAAPRA